MKLISVEENKLSNQCLRLCLMLGRVVDPSWLLERNMFVLHDQYSHDGAKIPLETNNYR